MPTSPIDVRMARPEGAYGQVSRRLMTIDPRFDGVDRKIDLRFDALDTKIEPRFMWTVGSIVSTCLASTGATIVAVSFQH